MPPKGKAYFQKYRVAWQEDEQLKGWISPHPNNDRRVMCKYCCCEIRAHKIALYKHFQTKKHKRHTKNPMISSHNQVSHSEMTNLFISESKPRKSEKIVAADGSYIIIESEPGVLSPPKDNSSLCVSPNSKSIHETAASQPINETGQSQSQEESVELNPAFNSDQEITEAVNQVGCILMNDMTKFLRTQRNIMKGFKSDGQLIFSEANLRKMARICIGHLSQKYLVEAAFELNLLHSSKLKEKVDLTNDFQSLKEKLEITLREMNHLKMRFEDIANVIPSQSFDLGDLTSPNSQCG